MNWQLFWDKAASDTNDELAQVQRANSDSIQLTVNNILTILKIEVDDDILDVCCGNGLITNEISKHCKSIIGIDLSSNLINIAKEKYPKIKFHQSEAEKITSVLSNQKFDKIYLQFSFQYFDKPKQGEKVISEMLKLLKSNGRIFIGDIPDHQKTWDYYDSFMKRFYFVTGKLRGKNRMGKFWKKEELDSICKALNIKGRYIEQINTLPYSHYRFDYLIEN